MDNVKKKIQSVQRAIEILNCFDESNSELSLSQLSQMTGLNKSTLHGIISTLADNDFIQKNSYGKYLLGCAFLEKFQETTSSRRALLISCAKPYMKQISTSSGSTVNLFIRERGSMSLAYQQLPVNSTYIISKVSESDPLFSTATGKLALLYMSETERNNYLSENPLISFTATTKATEKELAHELDLIREQGYAFEDGELLEGVSALSVGIFGSRRQLQGAISCMGTSARINRYKEEIIDELRRACSNISKRLYAEEKDKHIQG